MDAFREATYSQLKRLLRIIDDPDALQTFQLEQLNKWVDGHHWPSNIFSTEEALWWWEK